ncbi:bile acid:sodium symporter family protein [Cytophagales bacterium LB-30]|uniref:Bile acid:sodium symporter family protein n=1 Tax=Shiella aurantiaca TaxID=3058365 RepID=A0ABT8F7R8_9BACT|nr:bile acid:sodium symporter family protein [Shiella aurantiaca]MDN4165981.1 bile acid:sodium symporter family protein [Shiella aurantiaca]
MEQSIVTAVFLPLALGIIMLGMGMTLTLHDFRRVFLYPKAILIGLGNQLLLLPLLGFGLALAFGLKAEFAVGLMLLALCPGGATSNIISHLAKADLALSISLTAISSTITNFSIPIFLNLALFYFMGGEQAIQLPIAQTMLQIFVVTLLPVTLGMWIKSRFPAFTERSLKAVNLISAVFFVLILLLAIVKERANIIPYFQQAGLAALSLNAGALLAGYFIGKLWGLSRPQNMAISIETGIQNGTLAIALALSPAVLNNTQMAIPPAIYSLIMFVTAAVVVVLSRRKVGREAE